VGAIGQRKPIDRQSAKTDLFIAAQVALAIVLLVLVVIFVPQPGIRLTNARFVASPCNQVAMTFVVTADFSLTNSGAAGGDIFVRIYVDHEYRAIQDYFVVAKSSIDQSMSVEVAGCVPHSYAVDTCLPRLRIATC